MTESSKSEHILSTENDDVFLFITTLRAASLLDDKAYIRINSAQHASKLAAYKLVLCKLYFF